MARRPNGGERHWLPAKTHQWRGVVAAPMPAPAAPPTTAPSSGLKPVAAPSKAPEPAPMPPPVTARWPHVSPQAETPNRRAATAAYLAIVDMTQAPRKGGTATQYDWDCGGK